MARRLPELWILRHGETLWNAEGRLQGHLDSALTERGVAQARAQGEILARAGLPADVRVLSSPSPRAWRTAEIAVGGLGLEILPEPRLMEIGLGAWQGRLTEELYRELPPEAAQDPHFWKFGAPGGERLEAMLARVDAVLAGLDGPAVLVTHGLTSRLLRCRARGLAPERLSSLPGGQGVVHHLKSGRAAVLGAPA
ncbi:MAG: histidine phosphatase family protein [Roseovarius sp.]